VCILITDQVDNKTYVLHKQKLPFTQYVAMFLICRRVYNSFKTQLTRRVLTKCNIDVQLYHTCTQIIVIYLNQV